jgi:hypothetical protein
MSQTHDDLDVRADHDGLRRILQAADKPNDAGDDAPLQEVPDDGDHTPGELPMEADEHVDRQLDKGLKETFPASDPVSINPGAD